MLEVCQALNLRVFIDNGPQPNPDNNARDVRPPSCSLVRQATAGPALNSIGDLPISKAIARIVGPFVAICLALGAVEGHIRCFLALRTHSPTFNLSLCALRPRRIYSYLRTGDARALLFLPGLRVT